jgi:parallel beta-helix repeat protein
MGTLYIDTAGAATNSGSTDSNTPTLTGTSNLVSVVGTTVTLPAGTDLTNVNATAGSATQDSINLAAATNTNQKIFWITGKAGSGGATPTVTVSVAPTGTFPSTSWVIGGRHVLTNASIEATVVAGDTVIFNNSPAAQAATMWTFRNAGAAATGYVKIVGKTGVRPVLTTSNTSVGLIDGGNAMCWVENLEIAQQGASGNAMTMSGSGAVIYNVKVTDGGATGISLSANNQRVIRCEVTGVLANGILTGATSIIFGNYVHACGTDGISNASATPTVVIANNLVTNNGARGIKFTGAASTPVNFIAVIGNTIYGNADSGLELQDADLTTTLINNIFQDNGAGAGQFNVEGTGNLDINGSFHAWNCFFKASNNLSNITANGQVSGSEVTTDPLMVLPASADFRLKPGSPSENIGYPGQILGLTTGGLGYRDLGALPAKKFPVPPMGLQSLDGGLSA